MEREQINEAFGVTEEQLDASAQEFEEGTWTGTLGPVIPGRPRLYDEELETVSFRIPKSRLRAIDARAKNRSQTRSQFLRQAVDEALVR